MNIFLVEDNKNLNEYITETLGSVGYDVKSCNDGKKAFSLIEKYYDLYLIDINLPNINGLELVKKIKEIHDSAKIFIVSGDDNIETIIKAYDLGCNDYIKKPFDLREVIAKINIISKSLNKNLFKLSSDCVYNKNNRVIIYDDTRINLTKKEALLLDIFVENIGKIVSNVEIEKKIWGEERANGHTRQLVSKLKKALPCNYIIQNHSSNGYGIFLDED